MSKNLRKLAVMLCAILLCIGSFAGFALADDEGTQMLRRSSLFPIIRSNSRTANIPLPRAHRS